MLKWGQVGSNWPFLMVFFFNIKAIKRFSSFLSDAFLNFPGNQCNSKDGYFMSFPFSSLLQHGQLSRLEKGLNHPHGKDVHLSIHQDFFFLQKLFEDKEKRDTSESVCLVWRLGSLTSWHHSVIKPHRLFSVGIHPEAKGWHPQILKGVSQGLLNDLLQQRKGLFLIWHGS